MSPPPAGTLVSVDNFVRDALVSPSANFSWGSVQRARFAASNATRLVGLSHVNGWAEVRFADGSEQQYKIAVTCNNNNNNNNNNNGDEADEAALLFPIGDLVYGPTAQPAPVSTSPCPRPDLIGQPVTVANFTPLMEVAPGPHWRWGTQHTDAGNDSGVGLLLRLDTEHGGWASVRFSARDKDASYRVGLHGALDLVYGRVCMQQRQYLTDAALRASGTAAVPGHDVTLSNAVPGAVVSRGRSWCHGMQDGGKPGVLIRVHNKSAFVLWQDNTENRYRIPDDTRNNGKDDEGAQEEQQQGGGTASSSPADLCYGETPATTIGFESPHIAPRTGSFTLRDVMRAVDVFPAGGGAFLAVGVADRSTTIFSEEVFDAADQSNNDVIECAFVVSHLRSRGVAALGILRADAAEPSVCAQHILGEVEIAESIAIGIETSKAFVLHSDTKNFVRSHDNSHACTVLYMKYDRRNSNNNNISGNVSGSGGNNGSGNNDNSTRGRLSFRIDNMPFECSLLPTKTFSGLFRVGISLGGEVEGCRGFFCSGPNCEQRAKMYAASVATHQFPRRALLSPVLGGSSKKGSGKVSSNNNSRNSAANAKNKDLTQPLSSFTFHDFLRSIDVFAQRSLISTTTARATVFSAEVFNAQADSFEETFLIHGGTQGGDIAIGLLDDCPTADCARYICGEAELVRSLSLLIRPASICFLHRDQIIDERPRRRRDAGEGDEEQQHQAQQEQQQEEEQKKRDLHVHLSFSASAVYGGKCVFKIRQDGDDDDYEMRFEWSSEESRLESRMPRIGGLFRLAVSLTKAGQRVSLSGVDDRLVTARINAPNVTPAAPPASLLGKSVTFQNFCPGVWVTRSASWRHGDQDGRSPGLLVAYESAEATTKAAATATTTEKEEEEKEEEEGEANKIGYAWVRWPATGRQNRYVCFKDYASEQQQQPQQQQQDAGAEARGGDLIYGTEPAHGSFGTAEEADGASKKKTFDGSGTFRLVDNLRSMDVVPARGDIVCRYTTNATVRSEEVFSLATLKEPFSVHVLVVERAKSVVGMGIFQTKAAEECGKRMIGEVELTGSVGIGVLSAASVSSDTTTDNNNNNNNHHSPLNMVLLHNDVIGCRTDLVGRASDATVILSMFVDTTGDVRFECDGVPLPVSADEAEQLMKLVPGEEYCLGVSLVAEGARAVLQTGEMGRERLRVIASQAKLEAVPYVNVFNMLDLIRAIKVTKRGELENVSSKRGTVVSAEVFETEHNVRMRQDVRVLAHAGGDLTIGLCDAQPGANVAGFLAGEVEIFGSMTLLLRPADKTVSLLSGDHMFDQQKMENIFGSGGDDDEDANNGSKGKDQKRDAADEEESAQQASKEILVTVDVRHGKLTFFINGVPFESEEGLNKKQVTLRPKMRLCVGMSRRGQKVELVVAPTVSDPVEKGLVAVPSFAEGAPVSRLNFVANGPCNKGKDWKYANQNRNSYGRMIKIESVHSPQQSPQQQQQQQESHDVVTVMWSDGHMSRFRAGPEHFDLVLGKHEAQKPVVLFPQSTASSKSVWSIAAAAAAATEAHLLDLYQSIDVMGGAANGRYATPATVYTNEVFCSRQHPIRADLLLLQRGVNKRFCGIGILRNVEHDLTSTSETNIGDLPESVACGLADDGRLVVRRGGARLKVGMQLGDVAFPIHFSVQVSAAGLVTFFVNSVEVMCAALEDELLSDATSSYRVGVSLSDMGDRAFFAAGCSDVVEKKMDLVKSLPLDMWKAATPTTASSSSSSALVPADACICADAAPCFIRVSDDRKSIRHIGPIAALGPAPPLPASALKTRTKKENEGEDDKNNNQSSSSSSAAAAVSAVHRDPYRWPAATASPSSLTTTAATAATSSKSARNESESQEKPAAVAASPSLSFSGTCVSDRIYQLGSDSFAQKFIVRGGLRGGDAAIGVVSPFATGIHEHMVGETKCEGSLSLLLRPATAEDDDADQAIQRRNPESNNNSCNSNHSYFLVAILHEDRIIEQQQYQVIGCQDIVVEMSCEQRRMSFSINGSPVALAVLNALSFKGEFRIGVSLSTEQQVVELL